MNNQDQLEAAIRDLAEKKGRANELNMRIAELDEDLKAAKTEYKALVGSDGWGQSHGEIRQLKGDIVGLELRIDHESKPKVVWVREPKKHSLDIGKIVSKVTAKRIYLCLPGHTNCDMYEKDGTPVSSWRGANQIDIEATFGGPCPEKLK